MVCYDKISLREKACILYIYDALSIFTIYGIITSSQRDIKNSSEDILLFFQSLLISHCYYCVIHIITLINETKIKKKKKS